MVLTGLKEPLEYLVEHFGREKGLQFFNSSLEAIDLVEKLVHEGQIDCDFRRSGHLETAAKPEHYEGMQRSHDYLARELAYETTLVPPGEMGTEIGSDYYHGGLIDPHSAGFQPAKFAAGLGKMAADRGADLHDGVAALKIEGLPGRFRVHTNRGRIEAEQILLATNGYTTGLTPWQQRRIIPIGSYIIASEELPPELAQTLIPQDRMIFDTKNFLYYFRLAPDGKRLLFGGRAKFTSTTLQESAAIMHRSMIEVYPQLTPYQVEYAWTGTLGFTFDQVPHVGQQDGLYYALGYCGHGAALATYLGAKTADWILGLDKPNIFIDKRFMTIPFYQGKPWFLPLAQVYFQWQDRLG
jgi:glycine/D-amino acid oxidase-like deaminating enzyme